MAYFRYIKDAALEEIYRRVCTSCPYYNRDDEGVWDCLQGRDVIDCPFCESTLFDLSVLDERIAMTLGNE